LVKDDLRQACTTYGPRKLLIWPAKPEILFLSFGKKHPVKHINLGPWICQFFWPVMRFELCTPDTLYRPCVEIKLSMKGHLGKNVKYKKVLKYKKER